MILVSVSLLCFFGLLFIFNITSVRGLSDPFLFFKKQLVALFLGIGLLLLASRTSPETWRKLAPVLYFVSVSLVILTLLFPSDGAKRWIKLPGFSFQPVELLKFAVILLLASMLSRKIERKGKIDNQDVLAVFLVILLPSLFLILQPDFGSVVQLVLISFFFIFVSGYSLVKLFALGVVSTLPLALLVISSPYRLKRVKVMLNPWEDRYGAGFQIVQSILAFASGGLFGKGIGNGIGKLFFLPAAHTDLIISAIAEEIGFVGVLIIVVIYVVLGTAIFSIALQSRNLFQKLAVAGVGFLILSQVLINLLVAVGSLPAKGLPLPFVSYGGSSLLINLMMIGFVLSVEANRR